jgi:hypothetical protein
MAEGPWRGVGAGGAAVAEGRRRTGVAAEGHGGGVREKWRARRSEWRAGRNERGARQENGSKRGARAPG